MACLSARSSVILAAHLEFDGITLVVEESVRGVAQPGRVLRSGRRSRRFESSHPDHPAAGRMRLIALDQIRPPPASHGDLRGQIAFVSAHCLGTVCVMGEYR